MLWGLADRALLPGLLEGLADYVPQLEIDRMAQGTHWIVHEQPARVAQSIEDFIARTA